MTNEILIINDTYTTSSSNCITRETLEFPISYSINSPLDKITNRISKPFQIKRITKWSIKNDLVEISYYAVFENEKDALEQSFKLNIS